LPAAKFYPAVARPQAFLWSRLAAAFKNAAGTRGTL